MDGNITLLTQGVAVGILASIPLGPIGVLCIQQTINYGRRTGFASGYGAALADTIFATISAWGLSFIIEYIRSYQSGFEIFGGIIILIMGIAINRRDPVLTYRKRGETKRKPWQNVVYTMLLTLTNPLAIFLFLALMTTFGLAVDPSNPKDITMVVVGVHVGCTLWWFGLTYGVSHLRSLFRLRRLWWFNKTSGIVIASFGGSAVLHGLYVLLIAHVR